IAETLTGWQSDEAIGTPVERVYQAVVEASDRTAPNAIARCLEAGRPYYGNDDVVLVARCGQRRDIRDSAAPVRTADGRIIGAVLVFQDVTQSRTLQRELAH